MPWLMSSNFPAIVLGILVTIVCLYWFRGKKSDDIGFWRWVNYVIIICGLAGIAISFLDYSGAIASKFGENSRKHIQYLTSELVSSSLRERDFYCNHEYMKSQEPNVDEYKDDIKRNCDYYTNLYSISQKKMKENQIFENKIEDPPLTTKYFFPGFAGRIIFMINSEIDFKNELDGHSSADLKLILMVVAPYLMAMGLGLLFAKATYTV